LQNTGFFLLPMTIRFNDGDVRLTSTAGYSSSQIPLAQSCASMLSLTPTEQVVLGKALRDLAPDEITRFKKLVDLEVAVDALTAKFESCFLQTSSSKLIPSIGGLAVIAGNPQQRPSATAPAAQTAALNPGTDVYRVHIFHTYQNQASSTFQRQQISDQQNKNNFFSDATADVNKDSTDYKYPFGDILARSDWSSLTPPNWTLRCQGYLLSDPVTVATSAPLSHQQHHNPHHHTSPGILSVPKFSFGHFFDKVEIVIHLSGVESVVDETIMVRAPLAHFFFSVES
jgi:hypothetical protein